MKPLVEDTPEKGVLTRSELESLFDPETTVWEGGAVYYALSRVAAFCGLRLGECLGLRWEYVHDDHLHVCKSFEKRFRELKDTKTGETRDVPISPSLYRLLLELKMLCGISEGYVFSLDGRDSPVFDTTIRKWYKRALRNIGISENVRRERNISFHSLRHGFNTRMIEEGLSSELIRELTGHKSSQMTEHYSHADTRRIQAVIDFQESVG